MTVSSLLCNNRYFTLSEVNCDFNDDWHTPTIDIDTYEQYNVRNIHEKIKNIVSKENGFSIGCLNIRGLLGKYEEMCTMLNQCKFDILGLCETFLNDEIQEYVYKIEGYNTVYKHRNRHGGGVLMYIKEDVKFELIEMNVCKNVESIWIKTNVKSECIAIGVMYRPPSADVNYYNDMLNQLDYVHSKFDKIILMGDLNYNCLSGDCNQVNTIESQYDMKQLITDPTRETVTSSTLIDVMFSNIPQLHVMSSVYKISVSDHYMIYTILKHNKKESSHREITFRNFKEFNNDAFIHDLECHSDITDIEWSSDQFEKRWNKFKKCFLEVCNRHAPTQTRRLKDRNNPWVTPQIQKLMYERDYVKDKAVKLNDLTLWNRYTCLRNKVTQMIRDNKRNYTANKVDQQKNDSGKLWKVLNKVTGRDKKYTSPSNINADKYNEYFNKIGSNTVSHLQHNDDNMFWKCSKSIHEFSFNDFDLQAVKKILSTLGEDCNMDVLGFDSKLMFHARDVIAPILLKFYNVSLCTNIVLDDWKLSRITPVYKGKGSTNEEVNYRPISVICHVAKILEKLVQKQVMNYLDENDLITDDQSAYLKHHNTQTSLHRVTNDWLWNINDGLITAMCALDISKCFDTINHQILLKKLKFYGFNDNAIKWFTSYLYQRGHKVYCNNVYSNVKNVNIGVPQGSVLGPTLFLLYINDINNYLGNATCNMYADDVLIYCSNNDINVLNDNLQASIDNIKQWYDSNLLVVNNSKSNVMMITTRQREAILTENLVNNSAPINVKLDDSVLCYVDYCKYLGVHIDKNLNWCQNVNALCKDLNFIVWTLSRLTNVLPIGCLLQIYQSIMQPKIDYAITIWGYSSESNIDKVQRMQNRGIRAILNNYDYVNVRGIDLLSQYKIMNVKQRRDYFMSLLMFKSIHGLAPTYMNNEIIMSIEVMQRQTRNVNVNDIFVPDVIRNCTKSSFSYCGPVIWNSLPDDIKECASLISFKSKVKLYFMNKVY